MINPIVPSSYQYVETIRMAYGLEYTSICRLHKPCRIKRGCDTEQRTVLLDFDAVKDKWCKARKEASCPSVDAIVAKDMRLCFLEIKGWKMFIEKRLDLLPSENDKESFIDRQLQSYNFQDKLCDSIRICEDELGMEDLSSNCDIIYLLITDVDVFADPLLELDATLLMLANTSTSWETVCARKMGMEFLASARLDDRIHYYFESCRKLDEFMDSL
ncbi:hypothetical protein [Parabacteroides sp. ZJ-118]|uniref:hypothetical protein n=1 Tax=Parabacteroides sp. ZJ-118 TaxID=2709398 RepID=UPI0013ED44CD|nr:hypothetical protein [Parabacteroides sp. ZJ-118]